MTKEQKDEIDAMPFELMFKMNRFAPFGEPLLSGETGKYFLSVMSEKKAKLPPGEAVAISKRIGWR